MPMDNLVDELMWEIVTLVALDIRSLKYFALVNRRLSFLGRNRLFAQYPIYIRSRTIGMMGALRAKKGKTPADFIALLEASPELALIRRVEFANEHLVNHEEGLPASLEKLVNIQHFEICWYPCNPVNWTAIPQYMQNTLLNVVFPRLTSLVISHSIANLPSNLLDYAALLSHLDVRSTVDIASDIPIHPVTTLLSGRVGNNIHLTLKGIDSASLQLLNQELGLRVERLTIEYLSGVLLPITCLPHLKTLCIIIDGRELQVDDSVPLVAYPIPCLNSSLLGQKGLTLINIIFLFISFPVRFNANQLTKAAFVECDKLLEESCPQFKSVHAIFDVDRTVTSEHPFRLEDVEQELGELLPRCSEKRLISVEDITPDISPWP
ncbi:hypothetical protein DL96DRAFT_1816737 [Flagelloscypha sp. PMI_526]|nr:hypothetical protein DL96DRAFT_1816737 [Flagelloscypha sp. PMI_526]